MAKFSGVLLEAQSAFGGRTPDIPIPQDVLEAVVGEMQDSDPMYVTLPIGKVEAKSRNGRTYPRAAMEAMVEAINTRRPSGQLGHLRESDRPYAFSVGPLKWMAARIEADGTVLGKAYVMPFAEDVRQYIRMAKITRSPIGTSLYGMGETDDNERVISLQIESIDLVDPSRVGVIEAAVIPTITAEMVDESRAADSEDTHTDITDPKETPMAAEVTPNPALQGLAPVVPAVPAAPVTESEQARTHRLEVRGLNEKLALQENQLADHRQIVAELGNPEDPVLALRMMKESLRQVREENVRLLDETIKALVSEAVKVPTVVPIVLTMVNSKKPTTKAQAVQTVQETVDSPEVKALLASQIVAESGPAHQRPVTPAPEQAQTTFYGY